LSALGVDPQEKTKWEETWRKKNVRHRRRSVRGRKVARKEYERDGDDISKNCLSSEADGNCTKEKRIEKTVTIIEKNEKGKLSRVSKISTSRRNRKKG